MLSLAPSCNIVDYFNKWLTHVDVGQQRMNCIYLGLITHHSNSVTCFLLHVLVHHYTVCHFKAFYNSFVFQRFTPVRTQAMAILLRQNVWCLHKTVEIPTTKQVGSRWSFDTCVGCHLIVASISLQMCGPHSLINTRRPICSIIYSTHVVGVCVYVCVWPPFNY